MYIHTYIYSFLNDSFVMNSKKKIREACLLKELTNAVTVLIVFQSLFILYL